MTGRILGLPRQAVLALLALLTLAATACGSPAVAGIGSDFAINRTAGQVMRWNPCAPVHWRLDARIAPAGALSSVRNALAQVSSATGISFVYDGPASYVPQGVTSNEPAPLVVSFARHSGLWMGSSLLHGGGQIGEGGWSAWGTWNGRSLTYKITKGYAVIDTDAYNRSSSTVRAATLLHELGHAVGLNHAWSPTEVMYPMITNSTPTHYAAGDLSGLRAVGRGAGCI